MKKNYVRPQIIVRNTCVKNYVVCASRDPEDEPEGASTWRKSLTKERNTSDDIWGSDSNEESVW